MTTPRALTERTKLTAPRPEGSRTDPPGAFIDPKQARMLRQVETDAPSKAGLFRRLYSSTGRVSPRQAIKGQCLQCCWMDEAAIRDCPDTACPLWGFRPYQGRHTGRWAP